jgi:hypothetical protein
MRTVAFILLGVCLPMAGFSQGQQPAPRSDINVENQGAGIVAPRPNVTQPNIPQPNLSYACNELRVLGIERRFLGEQILQLQERYTEQHPAMQALRVRLSTADVALVTERARAASQGIYCSATESKPD